MLKLHKVHKVETESMAAIIIKGKTIKGNTINGKRLKRLKQKERQRKTGADKNIHNRRMI